MLSRISSQTFVTCSFQEFDYLKQMIWALWNSEGDTNGVLGWARARISHLTEKSLPLQAWDTEVLLRIARKSPNMLEPYVDDLLVLITSSFAHLESLEKCTEDILDGSGLSRLTNLASALAEHHFSVYEKHRLKLFIATTRVLTTNGFSWRHWPYDRER